MKSKKQQQQAYFSNLSKEMRVNVENNEDQYKIWDINPAFEDFNLKMAILKCITLLFLIFSVAIGTVFLKYSIPLMLLIEGFIIVFFLYIFNDEFFKLRDWGARKLFSQYPVHPFRDLVFWKVDDKECQDFIFYSNKRELTHIAMCILETEVMPENVSAKVTQFLRTIAGKTYKFPFTFQIIHVPRSAIIPRSMEELIPSEDMRSAERTYDTKVLFCITYLYKGIMTEQGLAEIIANLFRRKKAFLSFFKMHYPHHRLRPLRGERLSSALTTFYIRTSEDLLDGQQKESQEDFSTLYWFKIREHVMRLGFLLGYVIFFYYILSILEVEGLWKIVIILSFIFIFFFSWWREPFFYFSYLKLKADRKISLVKPLEGARFIMFKKYPSTIFMRYHSLCMGMKIFNLQQAVYPHHPKISRMYRAIMGNHLHFTYNVSLIPIGTERFEREVLEHLLSKKQKIYESYHGKFHLNENFLSRRAGIHEMILTISIQEYRTGTYLTPEIVEDIEQEVNKKAIILNDIVHSVSSTINFGIGLLKDASLISGLNTLLLKSKYYRTQGTHLAYLFFQGVEISELITIEDELKKAITTRVGAEFLAPLNLTNYLTIGNSIDPEYLEPQIPAGFMKPQLDRLLILNGTYSDRMYMQMKIAIELIARNNPCIIFDYTGEWSKIIRYFEGTTTQKNILHFSLGTDFIINLLKSGVMNDSDNVSYLEYFYVTYCLALKKNAQEIDLLRKLVHDSDDGQFSLDGFSVEKDIGKLGDNTDVTAPWEKASHNRFLIEALTVFKNTQLLAFLEKDYDDKLDLDLVQVLNNQKTIIIDFSALREVEHQILVTYAILAKFIQYIRQQFPFTPKYLFLSNTDIFFNEQHITKVFRDDYGKISMFLHPLIENQFKFICSTTQNSKLHPYFINHFDNFCLFKTIENADLKAIPSLLNINIDYGKGIYGNSRHATLQLPWIKTLAPGQVIIKRSDNDYPFPVELDIHNIKQLRHLEPKELEKFNKSQGRDIERSRNDITFNLRISLFEKDLGKYRDFQEEVIRYLNSVAKTENVSLHSPQLKEILLSIIKEKALKITKGKKKKILKIRDELFYLLKKHGYLVEHHPPTPAGSQSVRIAFKVGEQFQRALNDYFKSRDDLNVITTEPSNNPFDFSQNVNGLNQDTKIVSFRTYMTRYIGKMIYEMYSIKRELKAENYEEAIHLERVAFRELLKNARKYHEIYHSNGTPSDLDKFFLFLSKELALPLDILNRYTEEILKAKDSMERSEAEKIYRILERFISYFNNKPSIDSSSQNIINAGDLQIEKDNTHSEIGFFNQNFNSNHNHDLNQREQNSFSEPLDGIYEIPPLKSKTDNTKIDSEFKRKLIKIGVKARNSFNDGRYGDFILELFKRLELEFNLMYHDLFQEEMKVVENKIIEEKIEKVQERLNMNVGVPIKEISHWRILRNKYTHDHDEIYRNTAISIKNHFQKLNKIFLQYLELNGINLRQ